MQRQIQEIEGQVQYALEQYAFRMKCLNKLKNIIANLHPWHVQNPYQSCEGQLYYKSSLFSEVLYLSWVSRSFKLLHLIPSHVFGISLTNMVMTCARGRLMFSTLVSLEVAAHYLLDS